MRRRRRRIHCFLESGTWPLIPRFLDSGTWPLPPGFQHLAADTLDPMSTDVLFERFLAHGPAVRVRRTSEAGATPVVEPEVTEPEWVSQPVETPTFEMPEPMVAEPEPVVSEPEPFVAEPERMVASEPAPMMPELAPMFGKMPFVAEPDIEPVGQGQPIPQLTPVDEPSIIEVTEPEPAAFEAFRSSSESLISPEPVIETPI